MALNSPKEMIKYQFDLNWIIAENHLIALKDCTKNEYVQSKTFTAFHASGVKYSIRIYPNGYKNEERGKTWVFLYMELENAIAVESRVRLSITSAGWIHGINDVFDESDGRGDSCCTVNELFHSRTKFIIAKKLTIKILGDFKIKKVESLYRSYGISGLWEQNYKDFTIVVENKMIDVHKCVLASQSPVFEAMFKSFTMKEAIENKMEIPNFTFEIVEKSIKFCYHSNLLSDISFEDGKEIYRFGDQYDIEVIRDYVELYLGNKITVSNFYDTVTFAICVNAKKLINKCKDFFYECRIKKVNVARNEEVDKDFVAEVYKNVHLSRSIETL